MRSSGCTIQQALTLESATVVNQAVTIARRRGHGQVTPLHVANAMLSSSSAVVFRQACIKSHTHPLQCRALELCFNVALNRLPAASTSSSPMLSGPHLHPSISNALVAAFKRAQAHQRRGSIENQHQQQQQQQQTILAVKIEVEQLIISILDDPSVSRVMREAGFSSIKVKDKVEEAISMKTISEPLASKKTNTCNIEPTTPSLPSWLQKCMEENNREKNQTSKEDYIPAKDLCKSRSFSGTTLSFFSASPPSSSESSYERQNWFDIQKIRRPAIEVEPYQTTLSMHVTSSISSSDVNAKEMECTEKRFNDTNSLSLGTLCHALENKVPWQKEIVRDVASTVLNCRSRKLKRKEDTWFMFLGDDVNGKEKIGRELARLVFGSENKYISIGLSSFSSKENSGNKRSRNEHSSAFSDRLMEAISVDPHKVLFVEDIDQMDYVCQVDIKRAIEKGKVRSSSNGKEVSLEDAIIILSCERLNSRSRACSPSSTKKIVGAFSHESNGNHITPRRVSLDLNISISDDYAFDDQTHNDGSYVDELGLVAYVDKCILFKL